jgi:hypothetical protein
MLPPNPFPSAAQLAAPQRLCGRRIAAAAKQQQLLRSACQHRRHSPVAAGGRGAGGSHAAAAAAAEWIWRDDGAPDAPRGGMADVLRRSGAATGAGARPERSGVRRAGGELMGTTRARRRANASAAAFVRLGLQRAPLPDALLRGHCCAQPQRRGTMGASLSACLRSADADDARPRAQRTQVRRVRSASRLAAPAVGAERHAC